MSVPFDIASKLARSLTRDCETGGLSDRQVEAFLHIYDQQVPESVKANPEALQKLLDTSKLIARGIDDYDMPRVTITVQDFRFSPPSVQSELPCLLHFRLLPNSQRQQITVLDSSRGEPVASSSILHAGDTYTATICEPGSYVFTSEVYPFMSGRLTATGEAAAAADTAGQTAAAKDSQKEADQAAASGQPEAAAAAAPARQKLQAAAGRQSPAPGSRPRADSPRLAAKAALQQHMVAHMQSHSKAASSADMDIPAAADVASLAGAAAAHHPPAAGSGGAAAERGCQQSIRRVSDASDGLCQQPSECALLELLSSTATTQEEEQEQEQQQLDQDQVQINAPSAAPCCAADGTAAAAHAATSYSQLAELSRTGRWARRATAYDDEQDRAPHLSSSTEVEVPDSSMAAGAAEQAAATSHFSVMSGSSSGSMGPAAGAAAAAAAAATSAAHADASRCGVARCTAALVGNAPDAGADLSAGVLDEPNGEGSSTYVPEDMDIDDSSYAQQQQQQAAPSPLQFGFAKGLEGLAVSPEPLLGSPAPPHNTTAGWPVSPASAGAVAASSVSSVSEEEVHVSGEEDSCAALGEGDGGDWYERLPSDSDDHSTASSDMEQQQRRPCRPGQADSDEDDDELAGRHVNDEDAGLLAGQQREAHANSNSSRGRLRAWGHTRSSSSSAGSAGWQRGCSSGGSSSDDDDAAGDVRLRVMHRRAAAQGSSGRHGPVQHDVLQLEDMEDEDEGGGDPTFSRAATLAVQKAAQLAAAAAGCAGTSSSAGPQQHVLRQLQPRTSVARSSIVVGAGSSTADVSAQTSPLAAGGLALPSTAAGRAGLLPPLQDPPGGSWSLGGRACLTAGSVRSTFNSTGHAPGSGTAPLSAAAAAASLSSGRFASSSSASTWVVINDKGSGEGREQHSSLAAATIAAAAGADRRFGGSSTHTSYYDRLTSSSRTTVGLAAVQSPAVAVSSAGGGSTLLGPGTHLISQQTRRQHQAGGSASSGSTAGRLEGLSSRRGGDDPAVQYAALQALRRDKELRMERHQQQLQEHQHQQGLYEPDAAAGSDGGDDPPELHVRLQQKRQQQLAAAAAAAASLEQHRALPNITSSSSSTAVTAAAAAAKAGSTNKKKKGRSKAASGPGDRPSAVADKSARAAVEARRRERDNLECALWDRGGSSRGDSEDEAVGQAKASAASLPPAASRAGAVSGGTDAPASLSKCKFKACKLTFSAELNKHRCHMSHLPSARNATTKSYKAEVLAFLHELPGAAVAQLLLLPEPSSLPSRQHHTQQAHTNHQQPGKGAKASSSGSVVASSSSAAAAATTAAAIQRLQATSLSEAWLEASLTAAAAREEEGTATDTPVQLSELAQLCCGCRAADSAPSDSTEEHVPLLRPDRLAAGELQQSDNCKAAAALGEPSVQQQQQGSADNAAAAALAAAHVAGLADACCSLRQALPPLDHIVTLLERASEGTWLCNPRLLQQPHPASCSCSACVGAVATAGAGWSPDAVMASISAGLDVLDVLGEWGVSDAALSYVVERRLVTAFHKAKESEARRIMSQLLEETSTSNSKAGSHAAAGSTASGQQQVAAGAGATAAASSKAAAGKKKDKKKAAKPSKPAASTAAKKIPAWKAASSDSEGSSSDTEGHDITTASAALPAAATGTAADAAGRLGGSRAAAGFVADRSGSPPLFDSPSKGRLVAEQLLQARLLQQDQELNQLRKLKQQQQLSKEQQSQQPQEPAQQSKSQQLHQQQSKQQQPQQHHYKQHPAPMQPACAAAAAKQPGAASHAMSSKVAGDTQQHAAAHGEACLVNRPARGSNSSDKCTAAQQQQHQTQPQQQQHQTVKQLSKQPAAGVDAEQHSSSRRSSISSQQGVALASSSGGPSGAPAVGAKHVNSIAAACQQSKSLSAGAAVPFMQLGTPAAAARQGLSEPQAARQQHVVDTGRSTAVAGTPGSSRAASASQQPVQAVASTAPVASSSSSSSSSSSQARAGHPCDEQQGDFAGSQAADFGAVQGHVGSSADAAAAAAAGSETTPARSLALSEPSAVAVETSAVVSQPVVPVELGQMPVQQTEQVPAGSDTFDGDPQPQEQYQQQYQQQQAVLLHQHWMATAHSQACQDMFIYSGRAAAAAAGQEVAPFTPQEQQYVAMWANYYYYQQAYMGMAAGRQQQQPETAVQGAAGPQPALSSSSPLRSSTPASWSGSDGTWGQQQQQGHCQECEQQSVQQQQQQRGQQWGQQEEPPTLQLQFGSFPVEFTFPSPSRSVTSPNVTSPAHAAPQAGEAGEAGPKAAAAASRVAVSQQPLEGVQPPCLLYQQYEQPSVAPAAAAEPYSTYWWAYQQHYAHISHLQQQQREEQHQGPTSAAAAPELEVLQAVHQRAGMCTPGAPAASASPSMVEQQQAGGAAGDGEQLPQQVCTDQGVREVSGRCLPFAPGSLGTSTFLSDLASAMDAAGTVSSGGLCSSRSSSSFSSSEREAGAAGYRRAGAQAGGPVPGFDPGCACELLDSRWAAITQAHGHPRRQVYTMADVKAAHAPAACSAPPAMPTEQGNSKEQREEAAEAGGEASFSSCAGEAREHQQHQQQQQQRRHHHNHMQERAVQHHGRGRAGGHSQPGPDTRGGGSKMGGSGSSVWCVRQR